MMYDVGKELNKKARDGLNKKYGLVEKGTLSVSTFLSSKIQSGISEIRSYLERGVQFHQNNLFQNNQSQLYEVGRSKETGNHQHWVAGGEGWGEEESSWSRWD